MFTQIVFIIAGFTLLIKGADFLVEGSNQIAKRFHISEIVIGLTIVSIGTSMPELMVSISSSINGYETMAIGNVIGSNLCNLLLILGLSAAIKPIVFKKETSLIEIPLCCGLTVLFMILCNAGQGISRRDAVILFMSFVCFIIYTIYMAKKDMGDSEEGQPKHKKDEKLRHPLLNVIYIILGIVGLKIGGDLVVDSAENIAQALNISEKIISLTIVAIGTSLPELVTSVTAAIKGDSDIAIGNIIGSNIFNLLLIIGIAGIIRPMTYDSSYNIQLWILIASTFILGIFPYIDKKHQMSRSNGITYLFLYIMYMVLLIVTH